METNSSVSPSTKETLARNLRHLMDEADGMLKTAAGVGDRELSALRDGMQTQLRHLRVRLDELEDQAAFRARHALRTTDQAVRTHPYQAIGIAVAVGLLAGLLASRR